MEKIEGYLLLDRSRDWESFFTFSKSEKAELESPEDWYCDAIIHNLNELIQALSRHFDDEYIGLFIENDLSHYEYNILCNV